jgi:hypothetical protein
LLAELDARTHEEWLAADAAAAAHAEQPIVTIGTNYWLRLADGRLLGQLRVERIEDSWAEGPFTPTPAKRSAGCFSVKRS